MRYRLVDFLPLLLALALIGGWFLVQQPTPMLLHSPAPARRPGPATAARCARDGAPAAPQVVSRAEALLSLCNASRPTFLGTLGSLKLRLGARMGDAADCERPIDEAGNTQQLTTTGLAYYRHRLNVAAFTNGWDHWALIETQVVHWTGQAVDPPATAAAEP